jgi:Dyp-type peroxidase family
MAQAKGVLPSKADDRYVLYKNPRTCGYFIGIKLQAGLNKDQIGEWLGVVDQAVEALTSRVGPDRVASVATGFAPAFFDRLEPVGWGLEHPAGFTADAGPPTPRFDQVPVQDGDALFYVATVMESRVNAFLDAIATPSVADLTLERGFQREDESEPFGYRDGVRNVAPTDRTKVVYVHTDDGQPEEPTWADGGTYMVAMKIIQNRTAFASLPDDPTRDAVIGRNKEGYRLDHVEDHLKPHDEGTEVPEALPPTSHVRRAGPRGQHDDTQIFRRGLPFLEVVDGQPRTGLHFCSFQASPAQFDTIFNDWLMNQLFPPRPDNSVVGKDALLTSTAPNGQPLVEMQQAGIYFVPPFEAGGLVAALQPPKSPGHPKTGRLTINKTVVDPADHGKRFERGNFAFEVRDPQGTTVPGSQFTTKANGRGICPAELDLDKDYLLIEVSSPRSDVALKSMPFVMDKPNKLLRVENEVSQGSTSY